MMIFVSDSGFEYGVRQFCELSDSLNSVPEFLNIQIIAKIFFDKFVNILCTWLTCRQGRVANGAEELVQAMLGTGLQEGQVEHFCNICIQAGNLLISSPEESRNWFLRSFHTAQEWKMHSVIERTSSYLVNQAIQLDDFEAATEFIEYIQPCAEKHLIMLNLQLLGNISMSQDILAEFFSNKMTKRKFFSLIHVLKSQDRSKRKLEMMRRIVEFMSVDHFSGSDLEPSMVGFLLFLSQDESKDYCASYRLICRYISFVASMQEQR